MTWARHVARMEERRVVYRGLVGIPKEQTAFGKHRCGCEDNIKMDLT